jgi:hypothetical protein
MGGWGWITMIPVEGVVIVIGLASEAVEFACDAQNYFVNDRV